MLDNVKKYSFTSHHLGGASRVIASDHDAYAISREDARRHWRKRLGFAPSIGEITVSPMPERYQNNDGALRYIRELITDAAYSILAGGK